MAKILKSDVESLRLKCQQIGMSSFRLHEKLTVLELIKFYEANQPEENPDSSFPEHLETEL